MPTGKMFLENPFLSFDVVDLSDHIREISLPGKLAEVEKTCSGDTTEIFLPGLFQWDIGCKMAQNFDTAKVDQTLGVKFLAKTVGVLVIRASTDIIGLTNPSWTVTVFLKGYDPLTGVIGSLLEVSPAWSVNSGFVARATA